VIGRCIAERWIAQYHLVIPSHIVCLIGGCIAQSWDYLVSSFSSVSVFSFFVMTADHYHIISVQG